MKDVKILFQSNVIKKSIEWLAKRKYTLLLFSFLLVIFGNTFTNNRVNLLFDFYQNFFAGFFIFYSKKWMRYNIFIIILISICLDVFERNLHFINAGAWHGIFYLVFFSLIAKEVFAEVLYIKTVSGELLAAAMCGFVLLCLIADFVFLLIEINVPDSFSNLGKFTLANLNYFSFTTLLTIGYGDIVPVSLVAKRAVMLMGLIGNFYSVFVTGIIIGKYLSTDKRHKNNSY